MQDIWWKVFCPFTLASFRTSVTHSNYIQTDINACLIIPLEHCVCNIDLHSLPIFQEHKLSCPNPQVPSDCFQQKPQRSHPAVPALTGHGGGKAICLGAHQPLPQLILPAALRPHQHDGTLPVGWLMVQGHFLVGQNFLIVIISRERTIKQSQSTLLTVSWIAWHAGSDFRQFPNLCPASESAKQQKPKDYHVPKYDENFSLSWGGKKFHLLLFITLYITSSTNPRNNFLQKKKVSSTRVTLHSQRQQL